jgi:protein-S-isoprenylcysteine O-methyltransferase Ste14
MPSLIGIVQACWVVFFVVWAITSFQAKASVQRSFGSGGWFVRLGILVVVVMLGRATAQGLLPRLTFPYGAMLVGAALAVLGVGFAVWARLTLGSNWGMPMTLRENPELVTGGPYAFVRHPIYTGLIFAVLGTALVFGGIWLSIFVVACVYFALSAGREEKDMVERFPDAYPAYRARTKRLVPFVY